MVVFLTGEVFNKYETLATILSSPYEENNVVSIRNETTNFPYKPSGGVWFSEVLENNETLWEENFSSFGDKHHISFNKEAKIVVINTHKEYMDIVDKFTHIYSCYMFTPEGASKVFAKGLDYELMASVFDAIYVTQNLINEHYKQYYSVSVPERFNCSDGYVNLTLFDIASLIILKTINTKIT